MVVVVVLQRVGELALARHSILIYDSPCHNPDNYIDLQNKLSKGSQVNSSSAGPLLVTQTASAFKGSAENNPANVQGKCGVLIAKTALLNYINIELYKIYTPISELI